MKRDQVHKGMYFITLLSINGYGGAREPKVLVKEHTYGKIEEVYDDDQTFLATWYNDNWSQCSLRSEHKFSDFKYIKEILPTKALT